MWVADSAKRRGFMKTFLSFFYYNDSVAFMLRSFFSLILTAVLSGIVGAEREHMNRPAGIRTHILVGVSATLVMLTSEFLVIRYHGTVTLDPTRLGAQVISGIGFLGAGTIIKAGYNVKGLTTAASLWSIACIGLAVGAGFYSGAILLTAVVHFTLLSLKKIMDKHTHYKTLLVYTRNTDRMYRELKQTLEEYGVFFHNVEIIIGKQQNDSVGLRILLTFPKELRDTEYVLARIRQMDEVEDALWIG